MRNKHSVTVGKTYKWGTICAKQLEKDLQPEMALDPYNAAQVPM